MTKVCLVKAMIPVAMYGCELDHKESWELKNWCFWSVALEKTLESPLDFEEIKPVNPKGNQPWIFIGRTCWSWSSKTLATWCEELAHWKRPWCWERLKAEGEGDNRGWDGWMASPTQWTWAWVSSRSWWWTGRPGVLQSMGSQRSDTTEQLTWTDIHPEPFTPHWVCLGDCRNALLLSQVSFYKQTVTKSQRRQTVDQWREGMGQRTEL